MSKPPEPNPHHVSTWKFVAAVIVVVGLVALVSPWLEKKGARNTHTYPCYTYYIHKIR